MIIKKFNAQTEQEAIIMAKEELGPDAIVMNVKTIKPKGLFRFFKKTKVELTAAIDDNIAGKQGNAAKKDTDNLLGDSYHFGKVPVDGRDAAQNAIEEKINSIARLLEQQMAVARQENKQADSYAYTAPQTATADAAAFQSDRRDATEAEKNSRGKVVDLIYRQLLENEVDKTHADTIVNELAYRNENQPIDNVLANAYQKIVLKLGQVEPITQGENKPKIIFFVGNTGVGKTTTMAKLASKCRLEGKLNIAMFSVDTYRIAAIEQIKTYASILNTPMEVIYTPEDMKTRAGKYKDCDLILVDTAGHSHKNEEQRKDLQAIIESVSDYEKEIYLVVSVTTKYNVLLDIAKTYGEIFDYKVIFTKLDETRGLGSILNLVLDTNKPLSYVTWGQNVPDDIGVLNPQIIAKKLLGGEK